MHSVDVFRCAQNTTDAGVRLNENKNIMCSIKKVQKDREKFLYTLLEYASSQKEFNPHFFRNEMLKLLSIDEGKFNKIQKSLGDQYCSFVDFINGKARYKIHTSNCWHLHDKFEDWKLNKSLKTLTISLIFIALFTLIVALPSAIESYRELRDVIKKPVLKPLLTDQPYKHIQKKEKQKEQHEQETTNRQ